MQILSSTSTLASGTLFVLSLLVASQAALAGNSQVKLEDTKNGSPLKVNADSEQAKQFLATGKNPYIGNQQAIAQGKKLFQLYSCTQCHGSQAQGQTAGGLTGPKFAHAKSATDEGMFEIIWAGTNGGMSGKGKGIMDPNNHENGLSADEVLKVIAWIRSQGDSQGK